jgi:hypothetical protein
MGGITRKLFGGGGKAPQVNPVNRINVNTPGFSLKSNLSDNTVNSTLTQNNTPFQIANQDSFLRLINEDLPGLRGQVAPNASLFRSAALGQLDNQQRKSRSNLIQQANQRSIRGTGFHRDDLNRQDREFAQGRAEVESQVAAQELALTQSLLAFEQQANIAQQTREFQDLGITSQQANQLASLNQQAQIANANFKAQHQAGQGAKAGALLSEGIGAFGAGGMFGSEGAFSGAFDGIGSIFGGGGSAAPTSLNQGAAGGIGGSYGLLDL